MNAAVVPTNDDLPSSQLPGTVQFHTMLNALKNWPRNSILTQFKNSTSRNDKTFSKPMPGRLHPVIFAAMRTDPQCCSPDHT